MPNTIVSLLNAGAYKALCEEITEKVHDDILCTISLDAAPYTAKGKAFIHKCESTASLKMRIRWSIGNQEGITIDADVSDGELYQDGRFDHQRAIALLTRKAAASLTKLLLEDMIITHEAQHYGR